MPKLLQSANRAESRTDSEDGFILLAVLFLVMLVLIGMAVAAPKIARSIQRDQELELVHRGEQYKRAIKLYYKKYGAYPTSIDQLVETNNVRFLRKRYKDPITGKDDWRVIYYGQAKVPPMGLFGQPLTGVGQPGAVTPGTSSTSGSSSPSTFGTSPSSPGGYVVSPPSNPFGSASDSANSDSASSDAGTAATSDGGATNDQSASPAAPGSTAATPFGTPTTGATNTAAGTASSAFGSTLGGGPIVGVGIPSTKASLIEYKKQKHYNQWEFVYNPIEDQLMGGVMAASGTTNPAGTGGGTSNGTGIGSGSTIGPNTNNGGTSTTPMGGDLGPGGATTSPPQQQQ